MTENTAKIVQGQPIPFTRQARVDADAKAGDVVLLTGTSGKRYHALIDAIEADVADLTDWWVARDDGRWPANIPTRPDGKGKTRNRKRAKGGAVQVANSTLSTRRTGKREHSPEARAEYARLVAEQAVGAGFKVESATQGDGFAAVVIAPPARKVEPVAKPVEPIAIHEAPAADGWYLVHGPDARFSAGYSGTPVRDADVAVANFKAKKRSPAHFATVGTHRKDAPGQHAMIWWAPTVKAVKTRDMANGARPVGGEAITTVGRMRDVLKARSTGKKQTTLLVGAGADNSLTVQGKRTAARDAYVHGHFAIEIASADAAMINKLLPSRKGETEIPVTVTLDEGKVTIRAGSMLMDAGDWTLEVTVDAVAAAKRAAAA